MNILLKLFKPRIVSDAASSYAESWSLRTSGLVLRQMTNRINFYRIILIFLIMPQERSRPRCSSPSDPRENVRTRERKWQKKAFFYYACSIKILSQENMLWKKGEFDRKCCNPDLNSYFPHEHHGSMCTKPQLRRSHFELLVDSFF